MEENTLIILRKDVLRSATKAFSWKRFNLRGSMRTFDMICGLSALVALDEITHQEIRARLEKLKAATTLEAASEVTEEVFNSASAGGPQPCPDMGGKGRRVVCCKGLFGGLVVMWTKGLATLGLLEASCCIQAEAPSQTSLMQ
ncbi:uncharacterized protein isoform X1 [Salmo salar]|uniref:Uncharacterized protein isoform X1 n=1 Tax=Salmo salar TaxID=8030 RepID=A0A1S3L2Q5_SALSA|nr:uncharacterized protein LOC106563769 isoform X1 [Salmo salar]